MPTPIDIYVAVAPQDADACAKFEQHLASFINKGAVRIFHQHKLKGGDNRDAVLNDHFARARIIVFLRTIHFENDARCKQEEDWAHQQVGTKAVIPVIVRPHNWNHTRELPLSLVTLPRNGIPVEQAANQDAAWTEVARGIYEAAKNMGAPSQTRAYAAPAPVPPQYQPPAPAPRVIPPRQTRVGQSPTTSGPTMTASSMLVGLVGLCLFGTAVYYYAMTQSPRETTPAPLPTTLPTISRESSLPTQCPSPCCGGSDCALNADEMRKVCPDPTVPCCSSGRKCVPLGCGENLAATQRFNLRLAHATVNGKYPLMDAQVCFRRVASITPRQCVPYSSAQANSDQPGATPSQSVPILLGDVLAGKGIEVEIWEKGQPWPAAQFTTSHDNIKATALCMGLKLAQSGNPDTKAVVFLDDP